MQLRSGSSEIRSTAFSLWLWRPGVETILGGCGHAPTGIDLNADAAVQSGRQMRRTRPRLPGPFLGTPTAAGLQEQPRRSFSQDVSEDFLFRYSATNGSTRGYRATFCTLVPGVSLPQDAS